MHLESYMLRNLSGVKYGHRYIVSGCYEIAMKSGYEPPPEGKDKFIDKIINTLNSIDQELKSYYDNQRSNQCKQDSNR